MPAPRIVMVAAVARNGVIGVDGGLPWHVSSDLKHFRAATWGKPMIMGRRTCQSIGRALPGRETIVVTRDATFAAPGIHVAGDIDAALALGAMLADGMAAEEIIVAGGGILYREAMAHADRLLITELHLDAQGDTAFPAIDPAVWEETSRTPHPRGQGDDAAYDIVTWDRRADARAENALTAPPPAGTTTQL